MICPKCECHDKVTRTKFDRENNRVIRVRRCVKCAHTWETVERKIDETQSEPQAADPPKSARPKRKKSQPKTQGDKPKGALDQAMAAAR